MAKKKKPGGSPAYMALFASLMILLLAFFILLNSLCTVQEAGFKKGIGKVKDAFGWKGSVGAFTRLFMSAGLSSIPGSSETGTNALNDEATRGKRGGPGETDEDFSDTSMPTYLRVKLPHVFDKESAALTQELKDYLKIMGSGLALFDYTILVRAYAGDTGQVDFDRKLAIQRADNIRSFLQKSCVIPSSRIQAVGYAFPNYFAKTNAELPSLQKAGQATYIYIFIPKKGGQPQLTAGHAAETPWSSF